MLAVKALLLIFLGIVGGIPTIAIVGGFIGTIAYKCYRKVKYNISMFD